MGFVLIEHDLDIALRVVERVTVLHNGRVLKEGTPAEIENDAEVQAIYMGDHALTLWPGSRRDRAADADRDRSSSIENLDVYYGRAHALQQVSLDARPRRASPSSAATAWARRRCATRSPGSFPRGGGSVRLAGEEILGLPPHAITERGVGYVPQGRRVWPSLSVDEHLRLAARGRGGPWTLERVYQTFPRLAERKGNGGARALRRRAADARDRARAAVQSAPARDGRADRGPRAGDRRAGRGRC